MHAAFTELPFSEYIIHDGRFPTLFSTHQRPSAADRNKNQKEKNIFLQIIQNFAKVI